MLLCVSFAFTGCEKEAFVDETIENGNGQGAANETEVPEGYFVANLMPTTCDFSRALVNESTAVQSLRFLLFKKQTDDDGQEKYVYYKPDNADESFGIVFGATNQGSGLVNQNYNWPLAGYEDRLTVTLPVGDYRVVFLGNMMESQFTGQDENSDIVYLSDGEYDNVRINLPSNGPQAFYPMTNDIVYQNAFYMGAADFNINNPSPKIVLQRLVSQSTFSRDLIDTTDAVGMLVQSIVDQIKDGQLSTDIVKGVLRTKLTKILLDSSLGDSLLYPLTTVVDRLVNILLGDLVNALHEAVLEQVTDLVEKELLSEKNSDALYSILNPWSPVGGIDAKVALAKSIDLNRRVKSYSDPLLIENITVKEDNDKAPNFTITSLNGPFTLIEAKVHDTKANGLNDAIKVLRPAVSAIDDALLAGLLINIKTSLAYTQESNQRYTTKYDLLSLKLTDSSPQDEGETINIETALSEVLDAKKLTTAILGDGILSGVLSGLLGGVDDLEKSLLGPLQLSLLKNLDLRLPNIAIGNISLDGRWDVTRQDDNTIVETEIGGYKN